MRTFILSVLLLSGLLLAPGRSVADHDWDDDEHDRRHWRHEHEEHERWEHEHWRPRVYPPPPIVVVPPPAPACPVQCWQANVCNAYGWCHWERHCEPRC
jgi:hypothetical protein